MTALVAAQAVIKVVNFVVSILVVRYLGAQEMGRYAYVLAFAYPFGVLADFGLAALAIREISQNHEREASVLALLRRGLFLLAGLSSCAMVGLALLVRHDTTTTACIVWAGLSMTASAAITPFLVMLTAREDLHLVSVQRVVSSVLGAVATLTVLYWGGASLELLAAAFLVNIAMLVFVRAFAGGFPVLPGARFPDVLAMIRRSMPFGLLILGFALYYRVDMIMLHWMRDAREVGEYAAAYRFLDVVILMAASIGGTFYPRFSNMVPRDLTGLRDLLETTWRPLLALGVPIAILMTFIARPLTLALFGGEFAEAGPLLQVLIWGSLPILLVNIPSHALNAADRVWLLAGVFGLSALVNIALNFVLIPKWGAAGASVATVLCEWLNLALVFRFVRREFGVAVSLEGLWRYFLAAVGMVLVLWLAGGTGLIVEALAGILTYAACLLFLGYLRSADMLAVRRLMAQ